MAHRPQAEGKRTQVLQAPGDPGPARPLTIFFVAMLSALFLAVGLAMVRHHFLDSESENYYSERVSTPWHFEAVLKPMR